MTDDLVIRVVVVKLSTNSPRLARTAKTTTKAWRICRSSRTTTARSSSHEIYGHHRGACVGMPRRRRRWRGGDVGGDGAVVSSSGSAGSGGATDGDNATCATAGYRADGTTVPCAVCEEGFGFSEGSQTCRQCDGGCVRFPLGKETPSRPSLLLLMIIRELTFIRSFLPSFVHSFIHSFISFAFIFIHLINQRNHRATLRRDPDAAAAVVAAIIGLAVGVWLPDAHRRRGGCGRTSASSASCRRFTTFAVTVTGISSTRTTRLGRIRPQFTPNFVALRVHDPQVHPLPGCINPIFLLRVLVCR